MNAKRERTMFEILYNGEITKLTIIFKKKN